MEQKVRRRRKKERKNERGERGKIKRNSMVFDDYCRFVGVASQQNRKQHSRQVASCALHTMLVVLEETTITRSPLGQGQSVGATGQ